MAANSMNSPEIERLLNLVRSTAEAGDWPTARSYLYQVLDLDHDNEEALLWLAGLAQDPRESIRVLQALLRSNPQNERALAGLEWARAQLPRNRGSAATVDRKPIDRQRSAREHSSSRWTSAGVAELLMALAVLCLLVWFGVSGPFDPLEFFRRDAVSAGEAHPPTAAPTATPTTAPAATVTPAPTASPTLSAHATATSTTAPPATPTAALVATATPAPIEPMRVAKRIDISLSAQTLVAYEGDEEVFRATVSTGAPSTPTVIGRFRIFHKLLLQTMTGPGYEQPDVPYVMYFYGAYSIHGAYWHNDFGIARSHGCVNLRVPEAKWLFEWADPPLPDGAFQIWDATPGSGTLVVVHE